MERLKDMQERLTQFINLIYGTGALMEDEIDLIESVETDLCNYIREKEEENASSQKLSKP